MQEHILKSENCWFIKDELQGMKHNHLQVPVWWKKGDPCSKICKQALATGMTLFSYYILYNIILITDYQLLAGHTSNISNIDMELSIHFCLRNTFTSTGWQIIQSNLYYEVTFGKKKKCPFKTSALLKKVHSCWSL